MDQREPRRPSEAPRGEEGRGFPLDVLPLLRCVDGGALVPGGPGEALARCATCGRAYPLDGPVLRMGLGDLHPESDRERRLRDEEAGTLPLHMEDAVYDAMEIEGTLEALSVRPGHRVLELGCGRGRFTRLIEKRGATVVGVDISLESLRIAADHIATSRVALVQADATKAIAAPRSFDRVLGTLTSNLPSRRAREDSYRAAAAALSDDGKLVFSTHHYGIRARLAREPKEGRYSAEGIYRYLLEPREIRDEIGPFFGRVRIRPICVVLPFSRRLGLPLARIDRIARRIPGTRSLGDLLLVEASRPTR